MGRARFHVEPMYGGFHIRHNNPTRYEVVDLDRTDVDCCGTVRNRMTEAEAEALAADLEGRDLAGMAVVLDADELDDAGYCSACGEAFEPGQVVVSPLDGVFCNVACERVGPD